MKVLWFAIANLRPKKRQCASNVGPPLPDNPPGIRLLTEKTERPVKRIKEKVTVLRSRRNCKSRRHLPQVAKTTLKRASERTTRWNRRDKRTAPFVR